MRVIVKKRKNRDLLTTGSLPKWPGELEVGLSEARGQELLLPGLLPCVQEPKHSDLLLLSQVR